VQWLRAEYREAFVAARESVNAAEAAGDSESLIQAENLSGLVSWSLNDLDRANRSLERALALAKAANLRGEVASTHNNRGLVRRSERRFAEAIAEFEASLAIDRAMANRWGEAYSLRNIGLTRLESGDAEGAVDPLQQAAGIAGTIGDRVNEAKALLSLADALARLARAAEAKPVYGRALAIAEELPLPEVRWRARYGLAQLARAEGRAEDARALLAATIEDLETIRAAIRVEEFQDGFLADKQAPYDAMVTLLLDLGDARAAFEFSERSRGRNFIDLLGNQKLQLGDVTDQRLLDRERELRSAVESLERTRGAAPQSERPGITERLNAARRAYSDFIVELRAANRQLEAFVRVEPVSLADVQALLPEDTRLLAYHVLDRELVAWLVGRDSLQTYRMPVGRGALAKQIASVRMRLQDLDPVDEPLAQLASALIVPLAVDLRGVRRLGIVPHRELHAMPFAALPVTAREALIDRCALFYVPSSSVLGYTIGRRPAAEALREPRVLALGNPSLGEKSLSLPFAQKEAERLALQFPGATEVTGGAATETWLRGNIADYTIVHIASHGEFDPEEPLFSSLLLTPDDANDGRLTAAEVFGLALRADLVTLSACQTGLGRLSNGDDIVGLNRAFVYAGTRQMVTSLWRVDDIATAVLMKHFYREIGTMDRAAALREAMLRVRARFPHPAYWSGVVLSGDWQ
jgi:CHAT domain-containing protein